jgi:prophage antirepressor-like protein
LKATENRKRGKVNAQANREGSEMLNEICQNSSYRMAVSNESSNRTGLSAHPLFENVRVVSGPDGKQWFVAIDAVKALGLALPAEIVKHHCKRTHCRTIVLSRFPETAKIMEIIPESDLFRIIMQCKSPKVDKLQDWIISTISSASQKRHSKQSIFKEVEIPSVHHVATGILAAPIFSKVRSVFRSDGHQWFLAVDIRDALGISRGGTKVQRYCKKAETIIIECPGFQFKRIKYVIIPENDVYRLAMKSTGVCAEALRDWLVTEVFPACIRGRMFDPFRGGKQEAATAAIPLPRQAHPLTAPPSADSTQEDHPLTEDRGSRNGMPDFVGHQEGKRLQGAASRRKRNFVEATVLTSFKSRHLGNIRLLKDEDDNFLFAAKDVAQGLGYNVASLAHVPEEGKVVRFVTTGRSKGKKQCLTEQGLRFFLEHSLSPKAPLLKHWLLYNVVPSYIKSYNASLMSEDGKLSSEKVENQAPCMKTGSDVTWTLETKAIGTSIEISAPNIAPRKDTPTTSPKDFAGQTQPKSGSEALTAIVDALSQFDSSVTPTLSAEAKPLSGGSAEIVEFESAEFGKIHVVTGPDGKIWFSASDVAKSAGYAEPEQAAWTLCKKVAKIICANHRLGGLPVEVNIISEADAYRLFKYSRRRRPCIERFCDWVVKVIRPALNHRGTPETVNNETVFDVTGVLEANSPLAHTEDIAVGKENTADQRPEVGEPQARRDVKVFNATGISAETRADSRDYPYIVAQFDSPEFGRVRILKDKEGNLLFIAKDVAKALGYNPESKVGMLFKHVPEEWKGVNPISTPGGKQEMLVLTEQGFYFFLGRSDKPKALPFQKWVAGEVIPSIRKRGIYVAPEHADEFCHELTFLRVRLAAEERAVSELRARIVAEERAISASARIAQLEAQILLLKQHRQIGSDAEPDTFRDNPS